LELREIILAAYRGRNEVLRASLSLEAHSALSRGLGGGELLSPRSDPSKNTSREDSLRDFLSHDWVTGFHDVQTVENIILPDSVGSAMGKEAFQSLARESVAITTDYKTVLNAPWKTYCEAQRKWAETDAVREMEHSGDLLVKKLSNKERTDNVEFNKVMINGFGLASQRFRCMLQLSHDPWARKVNWMFSPYTDLLFRRIVFSRIVGEFIYRLLSWVLHSGLLHTTNYYCIQTSMIIDVRAMN
jgi:hypothetical protein